MDITTSWVKPPIAIGGLDHLAVQAPCISLYGKMLPGITNVTDRARNYSFYPWAPGLRKKGLRYGDTFFDLFRRLRTNDEAHPKYDLHLPCVFGEL